MKIHWVAAIVASFALADSAAAAAETILAKHLAKLAPLVGSWNAEATVYPRGEKPVSVSIQHTIAPTLGGAYLEWKAISAGPALPSFLLLVTYDEKSQAYRQTYFYSGTAFQLTETGQFDEATREYRTAASFETGTGGRAYHVRSTTKFNGDGSISFSNWGRYDGEEAEQLDMKAHMTRTH